LEQLKNVSVVKIMKIPVVLAVVIIPVVHLDLAQVDLDQVDLMVADHQVVLHPVDHLDLLLVLLQELHLHLFLHLFLLVDMLAVLDVNVKLKTTSAQLALPVQRVTPVALVLMGTPVLMVFLVSTLKMSLLLIMLPLAASIVQPVLKVHLVPLVDLEDVASPVLADKMDTKGALDIQAALVNKAHLGLLALLAFLDLLVKKEEMHKNSLVAQDLKVHVVLPDQLVLLELQELMPLLVNLVQPVPMEVPVHKAHKETKDQKVKLEVKAGLGGMRHIVHAQLVMLMPMVVLVEAMAHIVVSKHFIH